MYDLVITDDKALVIYLHESGLVDPTIPVKYPVKAEDVRGKHVIGKLPCILSSEALSYTEIPLYLPRCLEGLKLLPSDYGKYAGDPVTYRIIKVSLYPGEMNWKTSVGVT